MAIHGRRKEDRFRPNPYALTSLPMAIQVRFQGSGWPMAARREPHLLRHKCKAQPGGKGQVRVQVESGLWGTPHARAQGANLLQSGGGQAAGLQCAGGSGPTLMNSNAQRCLDGERLPPNAHLDTRQLKHAASRMTAHLSAGPLMNSMESSASSTQGMMSAPRTPAAAAQGVLQQCKAGERFGTDARFWGAQPCSSACSQPWLCSQLAANVRSKVQ